MHGFRAVVTVSHPDEYSGKPSPFDLSVYNEAYTNSKEWMICIDNGSDDGPYISLSDLLVALRSKGVID